MNVDYNTETQEITVELNTPSIELDTPTGGRGLKGDTGSQGPKGDKGDTGNAATVVVGSTTTGDAGTSASVSNSGTAYAAVLDFTIPKGNKGDTGATGQDGVSPTVSTSKSGKTTTVTFTDVNGTSTATILDGEDASDTWGNITGTLSNQTDLQSALDSKADSSDIPTKVSDLTNDSGYITSSSLPTKVSDLTNDTGFITNTVNNLTNYYTSSNTYTKSEVDSLIATVSSLNIEVVQTLPTQDISTSTIYLVPNSSHGTNNYYDEYIYVSNSWELIGSTQVDLSNYYTKTQVDTLLDDKADSSDIPTKVSDLTNDAGYTTFSGNYNDLTNKPSIPDSTSDLTNDSGFITSTEAGNTYALKSLYGNESINVGRKANTIVGDNSTAIGKDNEASGYRSYAEGSGTKSTSYETHAEGTSTTASSQSAHAEGQNTVANGANSHAEGLGAQASGNAAHAEGYYTKASGENQHVSGKYNIEDSNGTYAEIIGNGTSNNARSNARTLDWSGNEVLAGSLTINGNQTVATLNDLVDKEEVILIEGASSNTIPDESDSEAWYDYYPNGMPSIKTEINRQNLLELYNEFLSLGGQNKSIKKDAYLYYIDSQHEDKSYIARLINVNFNYINQFDYVSYDIVFNFEFIDVHRVTDFGRKQYGQIFKVYCKNLDSSENAVCKESLASYNYLTYDYFEDNIQTKLVSGDNIKTINNQSLLGSGNIDVSGGGSNPTDVRINGTSITSNDVADIQTEGTYDATTNKIATMSDIPTVPTVGNAKTYYGTSSTSASTAAKTVTCSGFTLETGATIFVKFTNANSYNGTATLNVNSTGAKDIAIVGDTKTSRYYWKSGEIVGFIYDGTNYVMIEQGNATTTYYGVTKLSSSTSSTSEVLAATPKAVKTAYDLANGKQDAITSTNKLDYSLIDNTPTIPSKTSDLTNDSGYITGYTETDPIFSASAASGITSSDITSWNNKSNFSGSYNDLTNKPTIPDSTSDLTNDSGFIDNTVSNLTNYTTTTALQTLLDGKLDYSTLSSNTRIFDLDVGAYLPTSTIFIYYYGTTDTTSEHRIRVGQGSIIIVAGESTRKDFFIKGPNGTYVGYNTSSGGEAKQLLDESFITNNLTTTITGSVLDASQGKALKDLIDGLATVATSGSYNDLSNKPTIPTVPTTVSSFTNDAGYITSSALSGYATTSALQDTQDQVDANSATCISNSNKIGTLTDLDTTTQTDLVSAINETIGNFGIDSYSLGTDGYIRLNNGFQVAWVTTNITGNFTQWNGNIYFLNSGTLPSWPKPFTEVYYQNCQTDITYWTANTYPGLTGPQMVRLLRINGQNNANIKTIIVCFGKWK